MLQPGAPGVRQRVDDRYATTSNPKMAAYASALVMKKLS